MHYDVWTACLVALSQLYPRLAAAAWVRQQLAQIPRVLAGLVDLTDLAESVGKAEGGIYKYCRAMCSDGKMFMLPPTTLLTEAPENIQRIDERLCGASREGGDQLHRTSRRQLQRPGRGEHPDHGEAAGRPA